MVRTSFTFNDDKELVQIVRAYEEAGTRISWQDVAHRMRHTKHTATALQQRLRSLRRTHGNVLSGFPTNFFTPIERPRGRPPVVTRQLRALAVAPRLPRAASRSSLTRRAPQQSTSRPLVIPVQVPRARPPPDPSQPQACGAPMAAPEQVHHTRVPPSSLNTPTPAEVQLPSLIDPRTKPQAAPQSPISMSPSAAPQTPPSIETSATLASTEIVADLFSPPNTTPRTEPQTPPLSPSSTEQAVTAMFADVPRELVLSYDGNSIHKNVGEVMPAGIGMLLEELGDIDDRDSFFDIGSGLWNVVAQVVLATNVYRVVGIESQEQVQRAGIEAINRNPYAWAFRDRAPFVCEDVGHIRLASTSPFAEATVVYWNNVLFEPHVTEHVKEGLQAMADIRFLLSCTNFCPRHRVLCFNLFCASFEFKKVVEVPCSWKAELLSVYVYKSRYNE